MDHKQIQNQYPAKNKKENNRFMLIQKLKIMRSRVKNKKEQLDQRKENVEKKYELMNEMNNEMTIKASTLEHQGQNLINETLIEQSIKMKEYVTMVNLRDLLYKIVKKIMFD